MGHELYSSSELQNWEIVCMDVSKIAAGRDVPHDINVVIEIPTSNGTGGRVKS